MLWQTFFFNRLILVDSYCSSIVDEGGASIYSVSDEAQKELPDLDPTLRGAGMLCVFDSALFYIYICHSPVLCFIMYSYTMLCYFTVLLNYLCWVDWSLCKITLGILCVRWMEFVWIFPHLSALGWHVFFGGGTLQNDSHDYHHQTTLEWTSEVSE